MSKPASLPSLPGLSPGRVAIVTGAGAPGIGFAQAQHLAQRYGLTLVLCDNDPAALDKSVHALAGAQVHAFEMDVADAGEWDRLKLFLADKGLEDVAYLGLNAGVGARSGAWDPADRASWAKTVGVNLWGVVFGAQAAVPAMVATGKEGYVVITGSKQGITCPPGNLGYNVSKAAVKSYAEGLEHELRSSPASAKIHAHLLVPGWVDSKMTNPTGKPKADGAWTAQQTVEYAFAKFAEGRFYSICPDNEVTEALDTARMQWTAQDHILNRPPLSRWHPEYKDEFEAHIKAQTGK